jgi:hypothetical protein
MESRRVADTFNGGLYGEENRAVPVAGCASGGCAEGCRASSSPPSCSFIHGTVHVDLHHVAVRAEPASLRPELDAGDLLHGLHALDHRPQRHGDDNRPGNPGTDGALEHMDSRWRIALRHLHRPDGHEWLRHEREPNHINRSYRHGSELCCVFESAYGSYGRKTVRLTLTVVLLLSGCGGTAFNAGKSVTWVSDGNQLVLACGVEQKNCKSAIEFYDATRGFTEISLPTTERQYTELHAGDAYGIRVVGFDGNGNKLASIYDPVP